MTTTTTALRLADPSLELVRADEFQLSDEAGLFEGLAASPARRPKRNPLDPARLIHARSWFGAGALAAGLGALALRQLGWPAAAGLGGLGAAGLAYTTRYEPAHPRLERVTLSFANLPAELDGLRVGQISDTHLGLRYTEQNCAWGVEQLAREQPELIAVTGDLAGCKAGIPPIVPLLKGLRAPLGVYAVPGNHDYWEGMADVRGALALAGIPLLINRSLQLRWNGADLWLAGVDDMFDGRPDYAAARAGIPAGAFSILLSHAPDTAADAADYGFALQLSGHSHGGHVRLPGLGALTHPRYGARYVIGHHRVGALQLYVSRGLGGAAFRMFCPPELTIFTLRRAG